MGSKADDTKGRVKQAIGDMTDNDRLRREGTADRAGSKVKKGAEKAKDAATNAVDKAKEALRK